MGKFLRDRVRYVGNMANRLRELRLERSWTHEEAATHMGVSRSQFIKLERGERRLTADYISRAARAFGVSEASIISSPDLSVPLVGYVGAGEAIVYLADDAPFDYVESPPNSGNSTVCVRVKGDSMYPLLEDGDLIYYGDHAADVEDLIGARCVVRLVDGKTMVKRLRRGSQAGLFTLESTNAPPIEDVALEWAARIAWMRPVK